MIYKDGRCIDLYEMIVYGPGSAAGRNTFNILQAVWEDWDLTKSGHTFPMELSSVNGFYMRNGWEFKNMRDCPYPYRTNTPVPVRAPKARQRTVDF